jgi:hypothetical protein
VLLAVSAFVPDEPVLRVDIVVVSILPPPVEPALVVLALVVSVVMELFPSVVMVAESELVVVFSVPELQARIPKTIPVHINNLFILKLLL